MQPPSVVMKSKARILIDVSDVLFKTVLTHRVAPSDATLIAFKILEVLHHPVHTLLYEMPSNLKGKNFVSKFPGHCPQNTMAFFSSKLDGIKK